jgi:peroxiredoxin
LPSLAGRHHNREVSVHPLQALIDRPIPDLELPASDGTHFRFRQFVGERPLVLFFYLLNGTPG